MKTGVIARGLGVCVAVWVLVLVGQGIFGGMKPSVELVSEMVEEGRFEDWGDEEGVPDRAEGERREKVLRKVAQTVNGLDFKEREKAREVQVLENFFARLSMKERGLFVELTLVESMNKVMEALDRMPKDERQRFVEERLAEIKKGQSAEEMARVEAMGEDFLQKASTQGFKAYLDKASVETKMDLAPLMEALNEMLQGLTGPESFGGGMGP